MTDQVTERELADLRKRVHDAEGTIPALDAEIARLKAALYDEESAATMFMLESEYNCRRAERYRDRLARVLRGAGGYVPRDFARPGFHLCKRGGVWSRRVAPPGDDAHAATTKGVTP